MQTCPNFIEQNNDHTQIMRKIQFRSNFKASQSLFQMHKEYFTKIEYLRKKYYNSYYLTSFI